MEAMFETLSSDNLTSELSLVPYEQQFEEGFDDSYDSYELGFEGMSDETSSLEQSNVSSSSIPCSPLSTDAPATEQAQQEQQEQQPSQAVIFPAYAAICQRAAEVPPQETMPVIKREMPAEPVVRPAPSAIPRQPAAKRARTVSSAKAQSVPAEAAESKIPEPLNAEDLNNYLQTLSKGKSEDIELFRNMLRCHGSLTPEAEKRLKLLARQVKNRESAQLSRQRKREYVQTLKGVIDKMRTVDTALRNELNTAQFELTQNKTEVERWKNYAHDLQRLLAEHGVEVPTEPAAPLKPVMPPARVTQQFLFPDKIFEGPCGFGHMAPPKNTARRSRTRTEKPKKKVSE